MHVSTTDNIWQHRNFVILVLTGFLLSFGSRVYELALPLIIYDLTQSSVAMGTMRALQFLPIFLFGLFIGVFVDRSDKRRWMLGSVGLQTGLLFALFTYAQIGTPQAGVFYGAGFVLMMCSYGYINARISSIKWALPTHMMTSANAKFTFIQTFMQVMGPAISGAILFLSSLYYGLLITACVYLFALVVLSRIDLQESSSPERLHSFWREMREGWAELRGNRPLWHLTWFVSFFNATAISFELMVIFFVKDELQWTAARVGLVLSCAGAGGLLGSMSTESLRRRFGLGTCLALTLILLGLTYSLTGLYGNAFAIGLALACYGFATTMQNICIWAFRHESTSAPMMGRVGGLTGAIFKIGVPVALVASGWLAEVAGARSVFVVCGLIQIVVFALFVRSIVFQQR
ncbi:MAG: MFS transporter [Pseudomonadales bacterium]|nr:MFS transporter [Pseudomonadales bacterium]MCP5356728.1 MFS transporter [Pseudomonadales bacterium]